jgi:hypothetical protein
MRNLSDALRTAADVANPRQRAGHLLVIGHTLAATSR